LAAANDLEITGKVEGKVGMATEVGKLLAAKAAKAGIKTVVFDRRSYRYHGRVKALADGARAGGLIF
jgi:large subunit ribosomal protein L18